MMQIKPVRIQRSRKKGAKLESPNGLPVVCVTRPSFWGNPFQVGKHYRKGGVRAIGCIAFSWMRSYAPEDGYTTIRTAAESVEWYRWWMSQNLPARNDRIRLELGGKNLACWCKPGEPCHADVLLELANAD